VTGVPPTVSANVRTYPLELCFKGRRDYVQGTEMLEAVSALARRELGTGELRLKLAMHRLLSTQPDLCWTDQPGGMDRPATAAADFSAAAGGALLRGWLLESSRPVTRRVAFEESRIAAKCRLESDAIAVDGDPGFLPSEIAISMTKQLHGARFPAPHGRWIFTRLDLRRLLEPGDAGALSVVLRDNLHGRLTRSDLRVAGRGIGSIYFSLLPQ
jgi:hypothetical protein